MTSHNVDISFEVPFQHRLRFTRDVFGADQQILLDLLEGSGEQQPRVQVWIDEFVAEANPELKSRIPGGAFDLLFLNAGIMKGRGVALSEVPDADINAIFMTNAISPVRAADALIDRVARGGMVAFMSSWARRNSRSRSSFTWRISLPWKAAFR